MNSFEAMGEARLRAAEGQRQLAAALARHMLRVLDAIFRHLPQTKSTPW